MNTTQVLVSMELLFILLGIGLPVRYLLQSIIIFLLST